jgi:hypothetical protein
LFLRGFLAAGKTQRYFFAAAGIASLLLLAPYVGCHIVTSSPIVYEEEHDHRHNQRGPSVPEQQAPKSTLSEPAPTNDLNDIERFLAE